MPAVTNGGAALVTGGAVRLGRAIAVSLAEAGYDIALHYNLSESKAHSAAAEIRDLGVRCDTLRCDLSDADSLKSLIANAKASFQNLNVLINSASTYEPGSIGETTEEQLARMWAVNFRAPFFLMKAFRESVERGSIVNVLDNKIAFNQYHYAAYLSSKKALADLTKMAALEFAPGIRVNGVAPGVTLPAATRTEEYLRWRRLGIPLSEVGHPHHVCESVTYLLTNQFLTGQILFVDGGEGIDVVGRNAATFHAATNAQGRN
jgi:pteridine reductase